MAGGLCGCGCGERTELAKQTDAKKGYVKGQPQRYIVGHANRLSPVEYIERDEGYGSPCWVWQRSKTPAGYGMACVGGGAREMAHRVYYTRLVGPIPEGLQIDHLCRVRACVNPDHLEPVTIAENLRRGMQTKLTADDVREIRRSDLTPTEMAAKLGVSRALVSNIRAGRAWVNLSEAA